MKINKFAQRLFFLSDKTGIRNKMLPQYEILGVSSVLFTPATRLTPARAESFLKTTGGSLSSDLFLLEQKSAMLARRSADLTT